jgi:branched-subunit amino acid aminotransferase/4-amino-4-deoxychorismate lyase
MSTPFLWHNGHIKPWAEATVHVSTHALHYGSSVFEGERVYATPEGPAYFRLADHTRRLFESAYVYEIEIGYSEDERLSFAAPAGSAFSPGTARPSMSRSWLWNGALTSAKPPSVARMCACHRGIVPHQTPSRAGPRPAAIT